MGVALVQATTDMANLYYLHIRKLTLMTQSVIPLAYTSSEELQVTCPHHLHMILSIIMIICNIRRWDRCV